eukprot:5000480-Pleurochrysis_carterae.AAC.1
MPYVPTGYPGLLTPICPIALPVLPYLPTLLCRLCLGDVKTSDEAESRQHDRPIVDGATVCMVPLSIHSRRPTYAGSHGLRTRLDRATEQVLESA